MGSRNVLNHLMLLETLVEASQDDARWVTKFARFQYQCRYLMHGGRTVP
jgi:hypothetical protein